MIRRVAAVFAFLVVASGWLLAQDSPLPGPAGGFSGGTVPNATTFASPVVLTGDNAGGTGTLRIRPSDEDTQLVLCEASNNASPEVCSSWQHYNASTTNSSSFFATNMYLDSASALQVPNSTFGSGYFQTHGTTTRGGSYIGLRHTGGGSIANLVLSCFTTGATTATCTWGAGHTTTNDIRGPILNGGSATCNGLTAGSICLNDDTIVQYSAAGAFLYQYSTNAATGTGAVWTNTTGTATGSNGYYNASFSDADYADKATLVGYSKLVSIIRHDDVAAGSVHTEFRDNATGTGVVLMDVLGNGTVRPLLYGSQSNCSDGAGAAACSAAPAGSVVIDAGATTVVVSTTAVTANSQIFVQDDSSLGTKLGVTCNTAAFRDYRVSARTDATSFTITTSAAPVTNPACLSYSIIN